MTRIHDFIRAFRERRAKLNNLDSVSFESFCKDSPEKCFNGTKESSLGGDFDSSPKHGDNSSDIFNSTETRESDHCSRPGVVSILLYFSFMGVILILFIVLLMHGFGAGANPDRHDELRNHLNSKEYYEFSAKVHKHVNHKPSTNKLKIAVPQPHPDYKQCALLKDADKVDCYPQTPVDKDMCETSGCCWIPAKIKPKNTGGIGVPYCFYPPNYTTYSYINISETAFGMEAFLQKVYFTDYPEEVDVVKMTIKFETENRLHVKFTDPAKNRYEPPYPEIPVFDKATTNLSYAFVVNPKKFGFKVVRKSDQTVIFDTTYLNNFIFANQMLQITAKLPSKQIYGLGEHQERLLLPTTWSRYTMFNRDGIPSPNVNLYGSQPFYMVMENSGNSHGVLLLNSNAMDVLLQDAPAITFRTIGGVLDFYYFLGPTPADVVSQYTELIGRPYLPPYWGLGFHLCRFGYGTLNRTKAIMLKNIDAGLPLDTQWNDLDYMQNQNMFTYNKDTFAGLPEFVKEIHDRGMHYMIIVDPGISGAEPKGTYLPYDKGIEMDIFVKNSSGLPFVGKVWNPISTVWPDFTHPKTVDYWTLMFSTFHKKIPFDGAWIDMNEPSNFLDGEINVGCVKSKLETPPYTPAVYGGHLNFKTMCMSAKHYAGLHYNLHNIYGLTEAIVTNFVLKEVRGKRPMIISRSTFTGHGHYAGHWSGDIVSSWQHMKDSVPKLLSFSLFGIPMMGADICGFNGNTTIPLCARWSQLGAFYPFSRNHNEDSTIDQDPATLGEPVLSAAKNALHVRYELLPYLYSLFWDAHVNGDTVARPLFFEFPKDKNTYAIDEQFLWGPAVFIIPVLEENKLEVDAYIPAGIWYDYYTRDAISSKGETLNFTAPITHIPVLVRGGYIIPQQASNQTTTLSRRNKFELLVAPDAEEKATGKLYWDDGDSLNTYEEKKYSLVTFSLTPGNIKTKPEVWGSDVPNLGTVVVLGVNNPVTEVTVDNEVQKFAYDTVHKTLQIQNLEVSFKTPLDISWK